MNKEKKFAWDRDTEEIKGNFKLAIYAKEYIDNPNDETLNTFKNELNNSSSLSIATVWDYINKNITEKSSTTYKVLGDLIKEKFQDSKTRYGVYDSMLGDFVYRDEDNKKINM